MCIEVTPYMKIGHFLVLILLTKLVLNITIKRCHSCTISFMKCALNLHSISTKKVKIVVKTVQALKCKIG